MHISLNITRHCVGTEIKRQYNQLISKYFKLTEPEEILQTEKRIALLKAALESLDFGWLRAVYPELRGGGKGEVFLSAGTDGKFYFIINGEKIHAIFPNHPI